MDSRRVIILHSANREDKIREVAIKQVKNSDGPNGRVAVNFEGVFGTFKGRSENCSTVASSNEINTI